MGVPGFEYKTFFARHDKLEAQLNRYGEEGWRLHSCDAVIQEQDEDDDVTWVHFSVVMDRVLDGDKEKEGPTAIAMKG